MPNLTYRDVKKSATDYQVAKDNLRSESSPFYGWVRSGSTFDSFML
jgi:tRNA-specific adenosine deaminase 1